MRSCTVPTYGSEPLVGASNRRSRYNISTQSCSKACGGEFVGVAIAPDFEPMIVNSLIQSSLEIGIPHIDEMIASQDATDSNLMLDENAEDLTPYFFVRCHLV